MYKKLYMLSHIQKIYVIKDFFIYSFGALLLRSITILLMPLTLRKLTPSDFGKLSLITNFISISTAIIGLGLRQVVSIEYFHCNQTQKINLINNIIVVYTSIALPCVALLFWCRTYVLHYIFLNQISIELITPIFLIMFLYFFVELLYQFIQYERKALQLVVLQTSIALIIALLTFFFVWYREYNFAGIIWAQCIGISIASSIGIQAFKKKFYTISLNIKQILLNCIQFLKIGLPFIPTVLFGWILASGDRWILAHYTSMHEVGIYTIADMFTQLFYILVLYPWSGSYLPYMLTTFAQNKNNVLANEKNNQRIMYWCMFVLIIVITLGYFTGKSMLYFILPPAYHEALMYIWFLLIGQVFLLGSYFASCLIQFKKHTYFLAFALCIPALLNVALNIFLIPLFGLFGCTSATLISYIVYFLITLLYNHRLQKTL